MRYSAAVRRLSLFAPLVTLAVVPGPPALLLLVSVGAVIFSVAAGLRLPVRADFSVSDMVAPLIPENRIRLPATLYATAAPLIAITLSYFLSSYKTQAATHPENAQPR